MSDVKPETPLEMYHSITKRTEDTKKERDEYRDTLDQIIKLKWVSYMEDDASIAIEEAQTIARTVREKYKK